jgi:hypothetical protein
MGAKLLSWVFREGWASARQRIQGRAFQVEGITCAKLHSEWALGSHGIFQSKQVSRFLFLKHHSGCTVWKAKKGRFIHLFIAKAYIQHSYVLDTETRCTQDSRDWQLFLLSMLSLASFQ